MTHHPLKQILGPLCFVALTCAVSANAPAGRDSAAPIRIALVSDPHTTRGTEEDQPLYRGRFDRVIASVNAAKVDMVLIAGDLTQGGKPEEAEDFKQQVRGFEAPAVWVPGNHDLGNKRIPGKSKGPTATRLQAYEARLGPSFFVKQIGGLRILGINSQLPGSGLPREAEMWKFLEAALAKPVAMKTVAFMHMPPFVATCDEPGGDYWNYEPEQRQRLLALLKQGGVTLVLTGHLHYELVNRHDGMLFVTTMPVSFGLPRGVASQGWTLVTLGEGGDVQVAPQCVAD